MDQVIHDLGVWILHNYLGVPEGQVSNKMTILLIEFFSACQYQCIELQHW